MTRHTQLVQALAAEGVPPARAQQLQRRLERIAKAHRRRKITPIDRSRPIIRTTRKEFTDVVADFFKQQPAKLAAQIVQARARMTKAAEEEDVDAIVESLDLSAWGALGADVEPLLLKIALDGIAVAFKQIGFAPSPDIVAQVNQKAVEWAKERAAELVGKRVLVDGSVVDNPNAAYAITESTREQLRSLVVDAIEEGTSSTDLATQLEESYAFSEDRAETIARTELAAADVQGNLTAYRDSGMVSGKEWILGSEHGEGDPDECDDASEMGVVPLDDDFGGIGDPPAHPNCVCDILPVLTDPD